MITTAPGQIIFLNGTSSSGKTSIAQELLRVLDRPYFHMAVDAFGSMRAKERTAGLSPDELAAVLYRTRPVFIAPWPAWHWQATTSSSTTS
jgi:chloramphenicol 3-O phosphotransferase